MMGVLEGVVMELADCALPLLVQVIPTADPNVAFKDVSAAFLVGAMPRKEGTFCCCYYLFIIVRLIFPTNIVRLYD